MDTEDRIKLFGMSLGLVERDLDGVEERHKLDLQRIAQDDKDEDYYPQFAQLKPWRRVMENNGGVKKCHLLFSKMFRIISKENWIPA